MRVWDYIRHYFVPGHHNDFRPRILHRPWLIFFLAITLATEGFLVSNLIARQSDQQFLAAVVPAEVIALTNTERADNNVGQVTQDALLTQAAQAKANDMAANDYFSHTGPDGKTPWQWIAGAGYQYQYAGENLAVRFIDSSDVVNAWMESPTHRANIVKPVYTEIGVGVAQGLYQGQPATYVVQYFGSPKDAGQVVATIAASASAPAASTTPSTASTTLTTTAKTKAPVKKVLPKVEGAATTAPEPAPAVVAPVVYVGAPTPAQGSSFTQSFVRQMVRAFSEPKQTASLLLGFVATLLLIALLFTFFVHVQIQHPTMLASAAFVAFLALFFLILNTQVVGGLAAGTQPASVVAAGGGVLISAEAADTGYALFPQ